MMDENDLSARRLAVQIASQLPEDRSKALLTLEYAQQISLFMTGEDAPKPRTVIQLKPV